MFMCFSVSGQSEWKLVWSDDFDRDQTGPEWLVMTGPAGIRDGQLHLRGHGVTILTRRSFAHDIRLEYQARQDPEAAPVDLSSTTGASPVFGWGHLHSHGLNNVPADDPRFQATWDMRVEKEGRRIRFWVNDELVHQEEPDEILGGPGMDRIGFVTWGGMLVDNLKVYERVTPHPDSPVFPRHLPDAPLARDGRHLTIRADVSPDVREGIGHFNRGDHAAALEAFRRESDFTSLLGQAYVLGDPLYQEPFHHPEFRDLADAFEECFRQSPGTFPQAWVMAAREFAELKMRRTRPGRTAVIRLTGIGGKNNPFYHKARMYLARYHYWNGMEGGRGAMIQTARSWMEDLRRTWPDQPVIRQYCGEEVPWGEHLKADTSKHPAWAAFLREAYARNIFIMERFFRERQTPDGQLHGGWGDDVELLRTWVQIAGISTAPTTVRHGIGRLCQGVWDHVLVDGYGGFSDVEHSSEDSADSVPSMLFLQYGDPLWVERNLQSCRRIRTRYMDMDEKGYPRFRSSYFGGDRVDTGLHDGPDVGYCARPMKHFLWAAWQGHEPSRDWFVQWADGWRAATMNTEAGKLPGVAPLGIWYPGGTISPPSGQHSWHDDQLHRWQHVPMMHDAILAAYRLSGERKFLEPWRKAMEWATRGPLIRDEGQRGSEEWQIAMTSHLPSHNPAEQNRAFLYRWLSDDPVYDEYILRAGGGFIFPYRLNGNLDALTSGLEKAATRLRSNLELQTTEVLSTDRAALHHAIDIFGAYTGAVTGFRDAATPTFAVTYDTPSTGFAALVVAASSERIRLWLYQFGNEPMPVGLRLWQLQQGRYSLLQGPQLDGERPSQHRYGWGQPETYLHERRAEGPTVIVPPGRVWVVDLRLLEARDIEEDLADLALSHGTTLLLEDYLHVTVHNIGRTASAAASLSVETRKGDMWKPLHVQEIPSIMAPADWKPERFSIRIPVSDPGPFRVSVDSQNHQQEMVETNNSLLIHR